MGRQILRLLWQRVSNPSRFFAADHRAKPRATYPATVVSRWDEHPAMKPRADKRQTRLIGAAMVLLALAALGLAVSILGDAAFAVLPGWLTGLAMALYLLAHVLRALRLGIIAGPLLGASVRTTAALHFVCAPLVTVIPMKIGELVRLQQLWLIGRRLSGR